MTQTYRLQGYRISFSGPPSDEHLARLAAMWAAGTLAKGETSTAEAGAVDDARPIVPLPETARGVLSVRAAEVGVHKNLRGRPRLKISLDAIVAAVRHRGEVLAAARELGCSDAYIHVRFKAAGLTLAKVLRGS